MAEHECEYKTEVEQALRELEKAGFRRGLVAGIEALRAERDELLEPLKRDRTARPLNES